VTIEVRREWLWAAAATTVAVLLYGLGLAFSARDGAGRPVLLLPDVRAVETYRQRALAWERDWTAIHLDLTTLLADEPADLLNQSRRAQSRLEQAVAIAQAVEGAQAPGVLIGLHDQALAAAGAFAHASAAVSRWLSAPSSTNEEAAQSACQAAAVALAELQGNERMAG